MTIRLATSEDGEQVSAIYAPFVTDSAVSFEIIPPSHAEMGRRIQENGVSIDIDSWPTVPGYAEIEGATEAAIQETAHALSLDWSQAIFGNAGLTIEKHYGIPVRQLRSFTFDRIE